MYDSLRTLGTPVRRRRITRCRFRGCHVSQLGGAVGRRKTRQQCYVGVFNFLPPSVETRRCTTCCGRGLRPKLGRPRRQRLGYEVSNRTKMHSLWWHQGRSYEAVGPFDVLSQYPQAKTYPDKLLETMNFHVFSSLELSRRGMWCQTMAHHPHVAGQQLNAAYPLQNIPVMKLLSGFLGRGMCMSAIQHSARMEWHSVRGHAAFSRCVIAGAPTRRRVP